MFDYVNHPILVKKLIDTICYFFIIMVSNFTNFISKYAMRMDYDHSSLAQVCFDIYIGRNVNYKVIFESYDFSCKELVIFNRICKTNTLPSEVNDIIMDYIPYRFSVHFLKKSSSYVMKFKIDDVKYSFDLFANGVHWTMKCRSMCHSMYIVKPYNITNYLTIFSQLQSQPIEKYANYLINNQITNLSTFCKIMDSSLIIHDYLQHLISNPPSDQWKYDLIKPMSSIFKFIHMISSFIFAKSIE